METVRRFVKATLLLALTMANNNPKTLDTLNKSAVDEKPRALDESGSVGKQFQSRLSNGEQQSLGLYQQQG